MSPLKKILEKKSLVHTRTNSRTNSFTHPIVSPPVSSLLPNTHMHTTITTQTSQAESNEQCQEYVDVLLHVIYGDGEATDQQVGEIIMQEIKPKSWNVPKPQPSTPDL